MPKKHRLTRNKVRGIVDPNKLGKATMRMDVAALRTTCQFLGQTVQNGETICYDGNVWVCKNGTFVKTGGTC